MRSSLVKSACVLLFVALIVGAPVGQTPVVTSGIGPAPRHLGPLAFGPDAILFAADAEVDWVTGWCSDDAHSDATSAWVATCASPTAATLSFTASARRWRALRCCAARACTTQTGTAASLARGSQRQTGGRRGLFRGVRGYRALDGAQRHASASRNPIDRRLPRQRHRTAVQRRQHAQGAGDRHRPARVASQRVRGGLIPDRRSQLEDCAEQGPVPEQEGGAGGGMVRRADQGIGGQANGRR